MARMTWLRTAAIAAALTVGGTGCFGKFGLTRAVYRFNEGVSSNKFAQSAVTWLLIVIPIYGLAGLADFIVLNPIEVLTGTNPIGGSASVEHGGKQYALRQLGERTMELSENGTIIGTIEQGDDGSLRCYDLAGRQLATIPAATSAK